MAETCAIDKGMSHQRITQQRGENFTNCSGCWLQGLNGLPKYQNPLYMGYLPGISVVDFKI